jgi:isoleucyl-tRNA synthetase
VGSQEEERVIKRNAELLADELNVKKVRTLNAAGEAVSYTLNPLPKQLGQKYGSLYPEIRKKVLALDVEASALKLLAGESLRIEAGGNVLDILPEEVEVRLQAKEGYSVASEGAYLAALVTELTPDLISEGLAREFVRRVQDLRKTADLDIADRIRLYYSATPLLAQAVETYRDYIMMETLAVAFQGGGAPEGTFTVTDEFDQEKVTIHIIKA